MKVAFLIEELDPARGGMERSALEFLAELAALGVEAHVVTQSAVEPLPDIHVHILGQEGWTDAMRYRRFVTSAHRFLIGEKWDVVHAVRPCLSCDVYQPRGGLVRTGQDRTIAARPTVPLKLLRKIGLLFDGKERLLASLEQQLLTRPESPLVLVPSHYVGRQVDLQYGLSSRSVRRVFNGVRISPPAGHDRPAIRRQRRRDLTIEEDRPVAIFVGHNFRRKGLARVIDALADARCLRWHLLVVGRDARGPYERRAQRLAVADRVHFLGERPDVAELYWASDACLLPTYNDPCSRTVLEALSLGVPCITTAYDGSAECIRDGEEGFVLPSPGSHDRLAQALRALQDEETRRYMSRKARELASVLSMRRHAVEVLQIYREIATRRAESRLLCPA